MKKIIEYTETHSNRINPFEGMHFPVESSSTFLSDSICYNASRLAKRVGAKAIILFTHSGYTAIKISSYRPNTSIYAFTNNEKLLFKLSLIWGVKAFHLNTYNHLSLAISKSNEILKKKNLLKEGDRVIYVGSTPLIEHGNTNMLKVGII